MVRPLKDVVIRPNPLVLAAFLAALSVLVGLGVWQLYRLDWKQEILAEVAERLASDPVALPATLAAGAAADWRWRPVRVEGRLLTGETLFWQARTNAAGTAGVRALTPLVRPDGATVFIDRGWLPYDAQETLAEAAGPARAVVEGVVRPAGEPGWFTPENVPASNEWYWLDVPAMGEAAGLDGPVLPVVVQQRPGSPAAAARSGYPEPTPVEPDIRNEHLQYALTWFALALGLVGVFTVAHLRPRAGTGKEDPT